jgi:hypothetical protein
MNAEVITATTDTMVYCRAVVMFRWWGVTQTVGAKLWWVFRNAVATAAASTELCCPHTNLNLTQNLEH